MATSSARLHASIRKYNVSIDAPDFVARYPIDYDTAEGEHVGITPRMAYYLWADTQILRDDWNDAFRDPQARELHAESLPNNWLNS